MPTHQYEKRFGVVAVELGFVEAEQLVAALRVQVNEDLGHEKHRLLGEILAEQGWITKAQIQQVLDQILK